MTFLNPLLLVALAAVGVPLMLHLLNVRQPTQVDFSSLAFVKTIERAAVQKIKVKRWLLLALRMLAVACIVMAFARPYWGSATGTLFGPDARSALGVVVDNSASMQQDGPSGPYLDQALQRAQGVLHTLTTGDQAGIWPTVPAPDAAPALVRTQDAARADLDAVALRGGTPDLANRALAAAEAVAQSGQPRTVVYVTSDFQQTRLGDSLRTAWPEGVPLALLPVDTQPRANTGVTALRVASPIVEAGQPVRIEATVAQSGAAPEEVVASLYFDDTRVAQTTVSPRPDAPVTAAFTATPATRGWVSARVEVESDAFAPDDTRYLTFFVPDTRNVLVVRGAGQSTRFVELALSEAVAGDAVDFRTTVIERAALAETDLAAYDAVLLVGPERIASGERTRLRQYVAGGGGVLLFPHRALQADSYTALFEAWGGGQVSGLSGSPGGEASVATLERAAFDHPLFNGMFDARAPTQDRALERPGIWAALNWQPRGAGQTLIALSTGAPFLYEWPLGQGRALAMAVAPSLDWSELPTRGLFVPLLYRSIFYATAGESVQGPNVSIGVPDTRTVQGLAPDAALSLQGPNDAPPLRIEATPRPGGAGITVPALPAPGVYTLRADGQPVLRLAANHNASLTELAPADPESAAAHYRSLGVPSVQVLSVEARPESVASALEAQRAGGALWNVFLGLALICLLAEMAVARLWTPETAAPSA